MVVLHRFFRAARVWRGSLSHPRGRELRRSFHHRTFEQSNSKSSDVLRSCSTLNNSPWFSMTPAVFVVLFSIGVSYADPNEANGKSSVPTDHPPNYADIAKKERPRIQELIQNMILRSWDNPVALQITLRSAEKKKEPGASEDDSDEDLFILIFGSLLYSDKVEVEFIKKGSLTTEELDAFVSALQVAGTKPGQDKASGGRGSVREATTDKTISQLESMGVIIYGIN
ncbi:unnamed protein product [Brassica oleracea var. botrytis]